VVVAQHMPPTFTKSLADRLNAASKVTVREAEDGETVEAGQVLIAPGGKHLSVKKWGNSIRIVVSAEPQESLYKPCVDVMFNSAAEVHGRAILAVMLTGMGSNGLAGARNIKSRGGVVIAQNEATCVVYGMPRAVIDAKLADQVLSIESIGPEITTYF
jgi:two-component system chemotaxis response regulator CheB